MYTLIDELMASPSAPLGATARHHTEMRVLSALGAFRTDPAPNYQHWKALADMVTVMHLLHCAGEIADGDGLIQEAMDHVVGLRDTMRFTGPALRVLSALAQDYGQVLDELPARALIRAHRRATKRLSAVKKGKP